jgi:tRNA pseudouridine55 synthase
VLPIAFGNATRLLQFLQSDKAYHATIRFGIKTTTDDLEGEILQATPAAHLTLADIEALLPQFLGTIQQIPPAYSAIQVQGKRLYELARAGATVEVPVRTVTVYGIQVLNWRSQDYPELEVAIDCGTGTYIRAIARDLGDALQTGGTLAALIRTMSSGFQLTESITLDDLETQLNGDRFKPIPPEQALSHLPQVTLNPDAAKRWCQGQRIDWQEAIDPIGEPLRIHDAENSFLGTTAGS